MQLIETKLGKIYTELGNFIAVINPDTLVSLENMTITELANLSNSNALIGEIAKKYLDLLQQINTIYQEDILPIDPDVDIPEDELVDDVEEIHSGELNNNIEDINESSVLKEHEEVVIPENDLVVDNYESLSNSAYEPINVAKIFNS